MHNTAVLSTFHHLPNDCGTLDPLPDVRCESKNGESDSEADILRGRMDYLSNTHRPSQDSHLPDTLAESVDRETVPALILGMINPPSQEVLGGTGVVDVTFGTYPPYSVGPALLYHFPFLIPHPRVRILTRTHRPPPTISCLRPWVDPHFLILFDRWPTHWRISASSVSPQKWSVNQLPK